MLATTWAAGQTSSRPAVVTRLSAGPPPWAGYEALDEHLERLGSRPAGGEWLLDDLARSGLRGRGGAAFPTWRKWAAVAQSTNGDSVVVINASEGEPLSQKDRTLLAFRPHLVLDGAALAADTLGATDIVLYLSRSPATPERTIAKALKERVESGLPEPRIRVVRTAHRYVAGESSAVVSRVSGGPAKPRFSLQRSAAAGVANRPTLIQNAETFAHVAMIARNGSEWFRQLGTDFSPGSALVTLCGNVRNPGVYEVDLASRLGSVLEAAGGTASPPGGALLGGYFGTWLSAGALDDLPLDAERLCSLHGASLGCGVVAVLPEGGCGIAESTRILAYLSAESAGQCGPCVYGLASLTETMERVVRSAGEPGDVERVRRWVEMVRGRGGCRHPDGAVGQLTSALTAFDDHLGMHLAGEQCGGLKAASFPRPPESGKGWR
jgi:NADH:ubiquinone oxidoreductase subunit F (NADH-binding)